MRIYARSLVASIALAIAGCAMTPVSEAPSDVPPKLVPAGLRDLIDDAYTWDRPDAFGPVPDGLYAIGDAACLQSRVDLAAFGYHPHAQDKEGQPIPGGGFYCGVKLTGDQPDLWPPQLVLLNGTVAWDRPRAFGVIPDALKEIGNASCAKSDKEFRAIAYHPWAKDLNGQAIPGGGFFCARLTTK